MFYHAESNQYVGPHTSWAAGNTAYPAPATMTDQGRIDAGLEECRIEGAPRSPDFYYTSSDRLGAVEMVVNTPKPVEQVKGALLQKVAAKRYAVETGGLTLPGGIQIRTDRESQAALGNAYTSLSAGLIPDTPWKAANGWTIVTLAEITPIAAAVAAHVRACFAAEQAHQEAIAALTTFDELVAYDINAGWPT